ncbi:hypothetical protein HUJ04_001369 [Dendroctonus ponderosae]|nr:hypothetical protein HUJ04_001369 [Dendroctonus ponderosae]
MPQNCHLGNFVSYWFFNIRLFIGSCWSEFCYQLQDIVSFYVSIFSTFIKFAKNSSTILIFSCSLLTTISIVFVQQSLTGLE